MATIKERIEALELQLKQAKAKKRQIEARQKALESKKKRNEETRKKVIVGALILAKVEKGEWPQERLEAMLNEALSRKDDRALFGLPEKELHSS